MECQQHCKNCSNLSLCLQQFTCGHLFCARCISRLIFLKYLNDLSTQCQIQIPCTCKHGTMDFSLSYVYDMLSAMNSQTCIKHQLPSQLFCTICQKWLCEQCILTHNENILDHPITEESNEILKCTKHPKQIRELFCNDCQEGICQLCTSSGHSDHDYHQVQTYAEKMRNQIMIDPNANDLATQLNRIDQMVVDLKDGIHATLIQFDQLMKIVEQSKVIYENKMNEIIERTNLLVDVLKLLYSHFYYDVRRSLKSFDINLLRDLHEIKSDFTKFKLELSDETGCKVDYLYERIKEMMKSYDIKIQLSLEGTHSWKNTITLHEHKAPIWALIQLKDGRLASGSQDKTIKIWVLNNEKDIKSTNTLNEHKNTIRSLIQLKTGQIVSGAADNLIKIWEFTDKEVWNSLTLNEHKNTIRSLIQIRDGRLLSGSADYTIKVWEIKEKDIKPSMVLTGHSNYVITLLQMRDGRIASGSGDDTIKIWEVGKDTYRDCMTLLGHSNSVLTLLQLRDERLVSGSDDKTIKVWEVSESDFKNTHTLMGHSDTVWGLIQLKDGRIASGSEDKTIKIWEVKDKEFTNTVTLVGHSNSVLCLIQLKDGRIASGSEDNTIKIWD